MGQIKARNVNPPILGCILYPNNMCPKVSEKLLPLLPVPSTGGNASAYFEIVTLIFTKQIVYTEWNKYHTGVTSIAITDTESSYTDSSANPVIF